MKKDRITKLLQNTLSRCINQQLPLSTFGALITITEVQINNNLALAMVYLSFMPTETETDEAVFLAKIGKEKYKIKKCLVHELGHKLRIIPNVQFYIDNTIQKAIELEKTLQNI